MSAAVLAVLTWLMQPTTIQGIALVVGTIVQLATHNTATAAASAGAVMIALPDNSGKLAKAITLPTQEKAS